MKSRTIFLIQLFLWLSLFLIGAPMANAAVTQNTATPSQEIQAVQSMEDTLYAVHYDQDNLNDRVSRIEETVFGQPQSGSSIDARITKLQGSLSPKALGPLSPLNKTTAAQNSTSPASGNTQPANKGNATNAMANGQGRGQGTGAPQQVAPSNGPSTNGFKPSANSNISKGSSSATVASPEAGETDYPTVSQMEQKLFGKTFAKEDITQRLTRLENQVFKMPQTGSLADRTDNLRLVVLGDTGQQNPNVGSAYGGSNYGSYNGGYGQPDPQSSGYGYPQPPNYGGYNNAGYNSSSGGSASYGSPPQSAYGMGGGYGAASYGGLPNNVASAGAGNNINPMPGYGNAGGTSNVSYQPRDNSQVTPDMMAAMSEVEKEVLGTTYPAEPINARLDRVETKVFKTTSPEMNPQDRIQRVIAVASAGGTPMTGKQKAKATFQVLLPIILTILPLVLL